MTISKIPWMLGVTLALHKVTTSPTPLPSGNERAHVHSEPWTVAFTGTKIAPRCVKLGFWTVTIAELAVIIASEMPTSPVSIAILSMLNFRGRAENLRLESLSSLGFMLIACGIIIRLYSVRTLGKFFTFPMAILKEHKLVTSGPYSVVRHPAYSGCVLTYAGIMFWYGTQGTWLRESGILGTSLGRIVAGAYVTLVMAILAGLLQRMPREDAALKKAFGKEWDDWAQKVPHRLIPGYY